MSEISDEFAKARYEKCPNFVTRTSEKKFDTDEILTGIWFTGANWAYEWCNSQRTIKPFHSTKRIQQLEQKNKALVELLARVYPFAKDRAKPWIEKALKDNE